MTRVAERKDYDGATERIQRLGLQPLWDELEKVLTGFQLFVEERRDANGGAAVRDMIDREFVRVGGWSNLQTGGIDWTKCKIINGTRVCLGVEIQFSGRSDLLIVDVTHLRDEITAGAIDVGVMVVPSDRLGKFLTDRGPKFSDAIRAIKRARAEDAPLIVLALEHDGVGPALPKRRTRQGRDLSAFRVDSPPDD
jgi:hypothetical protein